MKRSNDKRRSVKEIKDGILNHYGTIEKNPSVINPIWKRKPYEVGGKTATRAIINSRLAKLIPHNSR